MKIEEYKGHKCANSIRFYEYFKQVSGMEYEQYSNLAQGDSTYAKYLAINTYVAMRKAAEPSLKDTDIDTIADELDTTDIMDEKGKLLLFEMSLLSGKKEEQLLDLAKKVQH